MCGGCDRCLPYLDWRCEEEEAIAAEVEAAAHAAAEYAFTDALDFASLLATMGEEPRPEDTPSAAAARAYAEVYDDAYGPGRAA